MPCAAAARPPVPAVNAVIIHRAWMNPPLFTLRAHLIALAFSALPSIAFAAGFSWTMGDFDSGVIAPSPLPAGDTLTITGSDTKRFSGGSFTNLGTVQWFAGSVEGTNGAAVFNAGLWTSFANTALTGSGTLPVFTNTGTLRKSGESGSTTIGNWIFANNAGAIDSQVGTILFNGRTAAFNDGSKFQGAGSVSIAADAAFNGALFSDNLTLASGVFTGTNAKLAGGVAKAAGQLAWTAGDFAGTWEIGAGNTLTASGTGPKRQAGGSLVNLGTVLWNATTGFQGGNNAALRQSWPV